MRKIAAIGLLAALAAGCAYALFDWAYIPHRCNAQITRLTARTESADAASGYRRQTSATRNLEELQRLRGQCNADVRVPLLIGANEEILGNYESAAASYRATLLLDQRPELYKALGLVQIQLGQLDEAAKTYATVARFAPETISEIPSDEVRRRVTGLLARD